VVLADDVCGPSAVQVAAALAGGPGRVLALPSSADACDAGAALWAVPPDVRSAAFLAVTSGSTGRPKTVAVDHRQIVQDTWVNATAADCYGADDVMAHTLPIAFNAGLLVTLAGPLVGATTAMFDVRERGVGALPAGLDAVGAPVLHASPAILRALGAGRPRPEFLARLRSLTIAGEAAYGQDVAAARALLPAGCTVFNRYGSSETSLITEFRLGPGDPDPDGPLPVGRPVGHTRVAVTDDVGRPLPPGEVGVVEVTRDVLAMGYWQAPELTAAAYRDNGDGTRTFRGSDLGRLDENGLLHLLGRRDHSVKIRGYLVEPGEVDAALHSMPDVVEAVTVGVPRPDATTHRLVAYVVSRAERPSAAAVRAGLRRQLPGHMVPETVVFCAALPRTERGKIDRAALPQPPVASTGTPAITEWEAVLAQIWARALELEVVGRDADFFELGGDSLAAEAVVTMVVEELQIPSSDVTTALLVEAPTVAEFALRLRRRPERAHQTLTTFRAEGTLAPLFVMAGGGGLGVAFAQLARGLHPNRPAYALHAHALERHGLPDWSVRGMSRRHLTTMFSVEPTGPYVLAGHSFGGVVAFDMAQQLVEHGRKVDLLVILDSFPPDPAWLPDRPALSPPRRVKDAVGLALTGLVSTPGVGPYWRFHRQSDFLARRYRARSPYPGRTLVLVTDSPEREARSRWEGHLSGAWRREFVGGDHHSISREPYAGSIAALIEAELAAVRAEQDT
jgi:thioesterase domain-containing protein/non-ribosomal peptide synthetase component E (peptide arylation enzyme)